MFIPSNEIIEKIWDNKQTEIWDNRHTDRRVYRVASQLKTQSHSFWDTLYFSFIKSILLGESQDFFKKSRLNQTLSISESFPGLAEEIKEKPTFNTILNKNKIGVEQKINLACI